MKYTDLMERYLLAILQISSFIKDKRGIAILYILSVDVYDVTRPIIS